MSYDQQNLDIEVFPQRVRLTEISEQFYMWISKP